MRGKGENYPGLAFSLSVAALAALFFDCLNISTLSGIPRQRRKQGSNFTGHPVAHIKLPSLNVFSGVLVCDDNNQLGYLASQHPLIQL